MKRHVAACAVLFCVAAGHAAFEPLGYGAAAKGMGGAYAAVAEDGTAAYWNPAGLALVGRSQGTAAYEDLYGLNLLRYAAVGYTQPKLAGGALSAHVLHLDTVGAATFFDYAETTYLFAFGRHVCRDRLSLGGAVRYYNASAADQKGSGIGFDAGALLRFGDDRLRLAAVWQDLNQPKIRWYTGAMDVLPDTRRLAARLRVAKTTDLALENDRRRGETSVWRAGVAQGLLKRAVSVRAGLHRAGGRQDEWGLSLGGGLRFQRLDVDYAWDRDDLLGNTQTFSVNLRFGP
jgi:hypothetical protein